MNLSDRLKQYREMIKDMSSNRQKDGLIIVSDSLALIKRRLINDGINANGEKFKAYTPKYAALRRSLGYPTDKRTHVFSGDMLRDVTPKVVDHSEYATTFEISANSTKNDEKLAVNSKRMGISLLKLSFDEREFVNEANEERLSKYKKKYRL